MVKIIHRYIIIPIVIINKMKRCSLNVFFLSIFKYDLSHTMVEMMKHDHQNVNGLSKTCILLQIIVAEIKSLITLIALSILIIIIIIHSIQMWSSCLVTKS